jgi:hypothetical protein
MTYPTQQNATVGSRDTTNVQQQQLQQPTYQQPSNASVGSRSGVNTQQQQPQQTTNQINRVYQQQPSYTQQQPTNSTVGSRQTEPQTISTTSSLYVQQTFQHQPSQQAPHGMQQVVTHQQVTTTQSPYGMQYVPTNNNPQPKYQPYPTTMQYQQPNQNNQTNSSVGSRK